MRKDRRFNRRQVLRYGLAAVATAGGTNLAFAQREPGAKPVPKPDIEDLMDWVIAQAEQGAGKTIPLDVQQNYIHKTFKRRWKERIDTEELHHGNYIVLGGLAHEWGKCVREACGDIHDISIRCCQEATRKMRESEGFNALCQWVAKNPKGRWCDIT